MKWQSLNKAAFGLDAINLDGVSRVLTCGASSVVSGDGSSSY